MNKDEIRDSVMAAIESSTQPLTSILRQNALVDGWDAASARSLTVTASGSEIKVESSSKTAADLEYGTEGERPNPAVRRFANRKAVIESTILDQAAQQLKGLL